MSHSAVSEQRIGLEPGSLLELPPVSPTKDWSNQVWFKSAVLRWFWGFYTQRLTKSGRWFLWPTVVFTGYAAVSLQLQAYIPFCYAFGFWVVALAGAYIWRPKVRAIARCTDRIGVGEHLLVDVEIEQLGRFTGQDLYVIPHRLPMSIDADPPLGVRIPPLASGKKTRASYQLRCTRRGAYSLQGFRVESDFPIGLIRTRQIFDKKSSLIVFPKFEPLARMELPVGQSYQPGGIALASVVGESAEYIGNREFREGDPVRSIDWRATARLNKPIVREYREEYFFRVGVILDTHVPRRANANRVDSFERAVSVAASVSDFIARQEHIVDLFAAGPNLYHFTAGRSLAYLDQILELLACVEANPEEGWGVLEPAVLQSLAQITTIICVFLDWTESRRRFVDQLQQQGVGLKVIVVRDGPCTVDPGAEGDKLGVVPIISAKDFEMGIKEL